MRANKRWFIGKRQNQFRKYYVRGKIPFGEMKREKNINSLPP